MTLAQRSILDVLRMLVGVPKTDVGASATIVKVHHYTFRKPVFGETAAGYEISWESQLESPKGVKYSLTAAY